MAVRVTRNLGMLLLGVWLLITGLAGLVALPMIPPMLMAVLALLAGLLILVGR
jgi:hypothetical protein